MTVEVSILCLTYNHRQYIEQTLEGFLNQKTNFEFEIIVHDDASTDGTQDILRKYEREYGNKIKVIYEEKNKFKLAMANGGYFRGVLEPLAGGRYIATCEGDDYWIDDSKLQIQYDFMNSHPDYICCGHAAKVFNCEENKFSSKYVGCGSEPQDLTVPLVLSNHFMQTATLFYKKGFARKYVTQWFSHAVVGDVSWLIYLIEEGKVFYSPKIMSVYRLSSVGSYSSVKDASILTERNIKLMNQTASLNIKTGGKYKKEFMDKEIDYACRVGIYGGLSFFFKDEAGKRIRNKITIKKWIGILFYRIKLLLKLSD